MGSNVFDAQECVGSNMRHEHVFVQMVTQELKKIKL